MNRILYTILSFLFFSQQFVYSQTENNNTFTTKVIGHKCGYNNKYIPNTLTAVKESFNDFDGFEMDVFISKDRTLWLSHDQKLETCVSNYKPNILQLHDSEIIALNNCKTHKIEYSKLEDIFRFVALHNPNKIISLDIKPWIPGLFSNINTVRIYKKIAMQLSELQKRYNLNNVYIESRSKTFMSFLKKQNSTIKCNLLCFKNPKRKITCAIRRNYDGISFKYYSKPQINEKDIELLHNNKLTIQAWTINSKEDFNSACSLKIDFIQTDILTIQK